MDIDFTGERFVPDKASDKLKDEHLERYFFASEYVQDKRVLDIACGVGYGSLILKNAGARYVDGVDISEAAILYAQTNSNDSNVNFTIDSITSYRAEEKYDVIVCFETIEHVSSYREALVNLKQLLSDDGLLIASSPNRLITSPRCNEMSDAPRNEFHTQEFTVEEFLALMKEEGFVVNAPVFGQKHQRYFKNRLAKNIYREVMNPGKRFSPKVTPVLKNREPRYFVVVASKSKTAGGPSRPSREVLGLS